jgi:adenine/guanine phosphoribosyltransferase-like PRPP-binding protein
MTNTWPAYQILKGYSIGRDNIGKTRTKRGLGVSLINLLDNNLSDKKLIEVIEDNRSGSGLDNLIAAVYGAYQKQTGHNGIPDLDKLIRETTFNSNFLDHYEHFVEMDLNLDSAEAFALAYITHKIEPMLRVVLDHPVKGVRYRDIGPVIEENNMLGLIADSMKFLLDKAGIEYDKIAAPASRGYLIASALNGVKKRGIIRITKAEDKSLPPPVKQFTAPTYRGHPQTFEIQDLPEYRGKRVVIVDDGIGSGGTQEAAEGLLNLVGATPVQSIYLFGIQKEGYTTNANIQKPIVLLPFKFVFFSLNLYNTVQYLQSCSQSS